MSEMEHYSPQSSMQDGGAKDRRTLPSLDIPQTLEGLDIEKAKNLKDQYCAELLRLQTVEAKNEREKNKVVTLAKGIILCLEIIHGSKPVDFKTQEKRSSGFSKSLKEKLHRRIGGCLACGGGVTTRPSRHDAPIELHHIIPRQYGGDDLVTNALLVCRNCHVQIHS